MSDQKEDPLALATEKLKMELGFDVISDIEGGAALRAEGTSLAVAAAFAEAAGDGEFRRGTRQAYAEMRPALPPELGDAEEFGVSGPEAARISELVINRLALRGEQMFGRALPAYEWIWLIRRTPLGHVWDLQSAFAVRSHMACLALGANAMLSELPSDGVITLTRRHGRRLAFLAGYASVVFLLTSYYRWIGKGGSLIIRPQRGGITFRHNDRQIEKRVGEYDRRVRDEGAWGGFGIVLPELTNASVGDVHPDDGPIGLVFLRSEPGWTDAPSAEASLERYAERFLGLTEVFDLLSDRNAPTALQLDPELAPLVCLAATYRLGRRDGTLDERTIMRVGYSVNIVSESDIAETNLGHAMEQAIAWAQERLPEGSVPQSVTELWNSLLQMRPSIWPLRRGPVIFAAAADAIVIDWASASSRLIHALRYPRTEGQGGNLRGRAFEESIHRAVEESDHAPAPWLLELIGRHLKLIGTSTPFGEIDAGATLPQGNIHLIMSCKSYPYSEAYERGDHAEVRKVSEKITAGAESVVGLCKLLMENRRGQNYVIPENAILVPALVTPRVMWSPDPLCWEPILHDDGPPLACGAKELISFLERISPAVG